jgi:hypothetical protein
VLGTGQGPGHARGLPQGASSRTPTQLAPQGIAWGLRKDLGVDIWL